MAGLVPGRNAGLDERGGIGSGRLQHPAGLQALHQRRGAAGELRVLPAVLHQELLRHTVRSTGRTMVYNALYRSDYGTHSALCRAK